MVNVGSTGIIEPRRRGSGACRANLGHEVNNSEQCRLQLAGDMTTYFNSQTPFVTAVTSMGTYPNLNFTNNGLRRPEPEFRLQ